MKEKTKDFLGNILIGLIIIILIGVPFYLAVFWVREGNRNVAQGEFSGKYWLPTNCTIVSEDDLEKQFPDYFGYEAKNYLLWLRIQNPEHYQKYFAEDHHYLVRIRGCFHYYTMQGRIMAHTVFNFHFPTGEETDISYLDDRINFKIIQTPSSVFYEIIGGIFIGITIDFGLAVVVFALYIIITFILTPLFKWIFRIKD